MKSLDLRLAAAIAIGKAAGLASRALHVGGGTTLPGVVARRIAPDTLRRLSAALSQGVVLVGGTNGKTTTTRMLASILVDDGRRVLCWLHGPEQAIPEGGSTALEREEIAVAEEA